MNIEHRIAVVFSVLGILCFFGMVCAGMIYNSENDVDRELRAELKKSRDRWLTGGAK